MAEHYDDERKKLRSSLPAAALSEEKLEKLADNSLADVLNKRDEWVAKDARLGAQALHTAGRVPYALSWGTASSGVAHIIAE